MLRGSRLFAGLFAAAAILALSCDDGASPGSSPSAQSETPTVVSSPTGQSMTPTPAATAAPAADGVGVAPAIPDPFELYVMKGDGSERKLLSVSPGATRLLWSPAGDRAAVITIISRETTELRMVTMPDGAARATIVLGGHVMEDRWSPRWSPTGAWLAYIRSPQKRAVLEVIGADGSGRRELAATEGDVEGIDIAGWTKPDTLMATRWDGSRSVVMEFNLTTDERREVTTLGGRSYATMSLSNDGSTLAAIVYAPGKSCERGSMPNTLWLVDLASGQPRRVIGETCYFGSVAWSPDDSLIAYNVAPGPEDPAGVYVLDVASGSTRKLGSAPQGLDRVLNWLGDGSGVLVQRYGCYGCTAGPPSLLFVPATGSGEQLVVDNAEFAVSPDNRKVLFGKDGLHVSAIFGGVPQTLVPPDADWTHYLLSYLGWSPDGEWLSFVRYHGEAVRQFEVNADGSDLTRLQDLDKLPPSRPAGPTARVPSPDGGKVAVLGFRLVIEDTLSGESVTVDGLVPGDVSWSPDGETLVLSASVYSPPGRSHIYMVGASGAGLRPLTSDAGSESATAFSPDGSEVAFVRRREGGEQVVAIDVETGKERLLFTAEKVGNDIYDGPVWSPDGKLLAVLAEASDGRGIYVVKADGTGARRVVASVYKITGIQWETANRLYFVTVPEFGA